MKALWTPWRMEHVLGTAPHPSHCLFEPEGDQPHSRKLLVLYRDSGRLCLLNRFPYTNGHLLVAPVRHAACVTDLEPKELHEVNDLVQQATQILREELAPDGFNIGLNLGRVAGAGIDVWYNYRPDTDSSGRKYPYTSPFHELDNVVLSPHRAASPIFDPARWDEVVLCRG